MPFLSRHRGAVLAATLVCWSLALPTARTAEPAADDPEYQDLILAVDVSPSMSYTNDKEGMRWDGIRFVIDTARPQDRIALVLFSLDAQIASREIDEGSQGFVQMDTKYKSFGADGRTILKRLVDQLQKQDQDLWERDQRTEQPTKEFDLTSLRPAWKFTLKRGTSVIKTLEFIEGNKLIRRPSRTHRTRVFLFTDGREDGPKSLQEHLEELEYIKVLEAMEKAKDGVALNAWTARKVSAFRLNQAPIFTFGLGAECDLPLLQAIAEQSQPEGPAAGSPGRQFSPFYHSDTNLDLVIKLQQVVWSLRRYWVSDPRPSRVGGRAVFRAPVMFLQEQGALIYQTKPWGNGKETMTRPVHKPLLRAVPLDLVGQGEAGETLALAPRDSRAYFYYALQEPPSPPIAIDQQFSFEFADANAEPIPHCKIVARTKTPLFEYAAPVQGTRYTPKDLIPFAVVFTPELTQGAADARRKPFLAKQFQVQATLTSTSSAVSAAPRVVTFAPDPAETDPDGPQWFRGEALLDDTDPASTGKQTPPGTYRVEATITAVSGPLMGKSCSLLRRTIEIGDYPAIRADSRRLDLSNRSRNSSVARLDVSLALTTHPRNNLALLKTQVETVPGAQFIKAGDIQITPDELTITGESAGFDVRLADEAWNKRPVDPHPVKVATVRVAAPWTALEKSPSVDIFIQKESYSVKVDPLSIPWSSKPTSDEDKPRTISAWLDTDLNVSELVRLHASPGFDQAGPPILKFVNVNKPSSFVSLKVEGLSQEKRIGVKPGAAADALTLKFLRVSDDPLEPGVYHNDDLQLTGDAIRPERLSLDLQVDRPTIELELPGGKRATIDNEITLLGLAGTHVHRTLIVKSALAGQKVTRIERLGESKPLRHALIDHIGQFNLTWDPAKNERIDLDFVVPRAVVPGRYDSEIALKLQTELLPFLVTLPLHVYVAHYGVRPEEGSEITLVYDPSKREARADIHLVTDAEKGSVRWWASFADKLKPAVPVQLLDPTKLSVNFGSQSILRPEAVFDSVRFDRPCLLKVVADCGGLKPGRYEQAVRFYATDADQPDGPPDVKAEKPAYFEMKVVVVVPGRVVALAPEEGTGAAVAGKLFTRKLLVKCYDCEPGKGEVVAADVRGRPEPPAPEIQTGPTRPGDAPRVHEFTLNLVPSRAGRNEFVVSWPEADPIPPISVLAQGTIAVTPAALDRGPGRNERISLINTGEDVIFRVRVDPSLVNTTDHPLELHARNHSDEFAIPLRNSGQSQDDGDEEAGDDIYSGRIKGKFMTAGDYEITLAAPQQFRLQPALVRVGFSVQPKGVDQKPVAIGTPFSIGTLVYGGNAFLRLFRANQTSLSAKDVVEIVNNSRDQTCTVKVKPRFAGSKTDFDTIAAEIKKRDPPIAVPDDFNGFVDFDAKQHLICNLVARTTSDEAGKARTDVANEKNEKKAKSDLSTPLAPGEHLRLGVDAKLTDIASYSYFNENGDHPSLRIPNYIMIELTVTWPDGTRSFQIPILVETVDQDMSVRIVNAIVLVLVAGGAVLLVRGGQRWWRKHQTLRRQRDEEGTTENESLAPNSADEHPRENPYGNADLPPYDNGVGDFLPEEFKNDD